MSSSRTAEIRINKRTVRIGHETYSLRNITRVHTLKIHFSRGWPITKTIIQVGFFWVLGVAGRSAFAEQADLISLSLLVVTLIGVGRVIWLATRRNVYILAIETAGTQSRALASHSGDEIHRVENAVVEAIEDPPDSERILHIGDVTTGDKIGRDKTVVTGNGNLLQTG